MADKQSQSHSERVTERFAAKVLGACAIGIALLALTLFVWYSVRVLLLIFASVLIAILLRGLADWVSEWTRWTHRVSLIAVLAVVVSVLVGAVWIAAPSLNEQIGQLVEQLPASVARLRDMIISTRLGRLAFGQSPQFNAIFKGRADLLGSVTGVVSSTLGLLFTVLVVLFTGLFLAFDPHLYVRGMLHLVPRHRRDRIAEVLGAVGYTLKWWMIGQALDMVVIGVATAIGLRIIGVPLAMVLGVIAALFNFIPNFGPLFSMVPAVLLALGDDPTKAIYVVLLFFVLQNLEGYVLMPIIQNRAVNLPGALAIISQVLLGILVGGLGLALAAPLAAATLVAVKMLYVEDTLGDAIRTRADHDAHEEVREVKQAVREVERESEQRR